MSETSTTYEKAIVTGMTIGMRRVDFILPYTGNLTPKKFDALADKLHAKFTELGLHGMSRDACRRRLEAWYSGVEKNVRVEDRGTYVNVRGECFGWIGHPKDSVFVL